MREPRLKGHEAIIARYGSRGSFAGRLLYSWLTLTMLFLFPWPLAVLLSGATGESPWNTPLDWYQVRLIPPALIAIIAAWLWRVSPAPTDTMQRERLLAPFHTGRVWPQVLVFLLGMVLLTALLMMVENTGGALKLTLLTCAEAAVITLLISGYMHGAFDVLLEDYRSGAPMMMLYALTFGIRGALATVTEEVLGQDQLVVALSAGIVGGAIIGAVAVFLRNRSGSLLPGFLALWLLFLLLPIADFYGG